MDWVIDRYYYIINFKRFNTPRIYPVYFISKRAAKRAIKVSVKNRRQRAFYEIIRGSKLKEFKASYVLSLGKMTKFTRYDYSNTSLSKKAYRTQVRRRLRRMGMLTRVKSKINIGEHSGMVKPIENKQKVAMSPNTETTSFRLERKNPNVYYMIIKKGISPHRGFLFKLQVLEVNMKTKVIKKKTIHTRRKDVIIPYLTRQLLKLYGNDDLMDRCREEGIRVPKT